MQPPQTTLTLRQQVDQLIAQASHASRRAPKPRVKNCCLSINYTQLIQHWFEKEPPALRQRKYSMTEFVIRFAGRFRPKPAARLLAEALRELGWTEHRDWTRAGRNRRYWQPPPEMGDCPTLQLPEPSLGGTHDSFIP